MTAGEGTVRPLASQSVIESRELTRQTDGPDWRLYPGAISLTGQVVLRHLSVPLEVETLRTDVAHVVEELHRVAPPGGDQESVLWRIRRVETLGPDCI